MTAPLRHPAQAAIEDLAGVPRIEELHAERDALVALNSRVKALKYNDLWKTLRDIELAKAAATVREANSPPHTEKVPSETLVNSLAHTDPAFVAWVHQVDAMFAAYETVEDRINALNELVNRGQALIRYCSSGVGLR